MHQTELLQPLSSPSLAPNGAEYTIYVYDKFEAEKPGHNRWHRIANISDQSQALIQAQDLFDSQLYQKVEVKQKIFHKKKGCHIAKILRVYENRKKSNAMMLAAVFLMVFMSAGFLCLTCL